MCVSNVYKAYASLIGALDCAFMGRTIIISSSPFALIFHSSSSPALNPNVFTIPTDTVFLSEAFFGAATVCRWIGKYINAMSKYAETLEPELGSIWHSDEMKVKIKGKWKWKWLWNTLDARTIFQLVSMIAEMRDMQDAKRTFKKSKEMARKKPHLVITDGLPTYKSAFDSEFCDHYKSCMHIADVALHSAMNNAVERMRHGSIREREKVTRGLKKHEHALL